MGRPASSIQAEIAILEGELAAIARSSSYSINGRSKTNQNYQQITKRLDQLYTQLGRANGSTPMITRGVLRGLR